MDNDIIVAIISGLAVAIPSIITTISTINRMNAVQDEKLKVLTDQMVKLTDKVEQHNNYGIEIPQIKVRVSHLEEEVKELKNRG